MKHISLLKTINALQQYSYIYAAQAYGRNAGRRMVVARSNCSRMGVES